MDRQRKQVGSMGCNVALVQDTLGAELKIEHSFFNSHRRAGVRDHLIFSLEMSMIDGTIAGSSPAENAGREGNHWVVGCPPLAVSTYFSYLSRKPMRMQMSDSDIIVGII